MMEIVPLLQGAAVIVLSVACFVWGILTMKIRIFPYSLLKNIVIGSDQPDKSITAKARGFDLFNAQADIVFIGDSIIEAAQWQDMFPSKKIANRGIASDTARGIITRMDGILATNPKKAFIMVGFNDLHGGTSVEEVFSDYRDIVRTLEDAGIIVVIQSTVECGARLHRVRDKIRTLNKKLQQFAITNGNLWIDLNAQLASPSTGLISTYSYDGIHLNGDGYFQWRELITDAVRALDGHTRHRLPARKVKDAR